MQGHLAILQGIITRMATNSANAKTWCVALVSAIVVVAAEQRQPRLMVVCLLPVVLSLFLDAYYLGLEMQFRDRYVEFVRKLHSGEARTEDLFVVGARPEPVASLRETGKALRSLSIWPFYVLLALMLISYLLYLPRRVVTVG